MIFQVCYQLCLEDNVLHLMIAVDSPPATNERPSEHGKRDGALRILAERRRRKAANDSSPSTRVHESPSHPDEGGEESDESVLSEDSIRISEIYSEGSEHSFIDDTDGDPVPLPTHLIVASRTLKDHFEVFVHYLITAATDPDILSHLSEEDSQLQYFN
jgi:hypothetical protein